MLPPVAQWGFDQVPGAWDSDFETFAEADFNSVLITAANFVQYKKAHEPYDGDASYTSPLASTLEITDWLTDQEPGIDIYIYENWPDMAPYISSFPPPPANPNPSPSDGIVLYFSKFHATHRFKPIQKRLATDFSSLTLKLCWLQAFRTLQTMFSF